jgi:HEAT repeat protein
MTNPSNEHIFISYARKDGSRVATVLQKALEICGHICWRDTRDLDRMQDFTAEIENAIKNSTHVVTCITPDTTRADSFVRREIAYAQIYGKPITPVIFDAAIPPPISIVNHTWVEQHKLGWDATLRELMTCFAQARSTLQPDLHPTLAADPFREYLQSLYKEVVSDLNRRVIKQIDLHGQANPTAVERPTPTPQPTLQFAFAGQGLAKYEVEPVAVDDPSAIQETNEPVTFTTFNEAFTHYTGRILLLGEPGAGKTTTLMAHARDAIARRLVDPAEPLPVIALIAAWPAHHPPPLADWLAKHNGDFPGLAEAIRDGQALLLLDGLDELGANRQDNDHEQTSYDPRQRFLDHIPANNQLVVTCRVRDYEQISQKAVLNGAVLLQPLTALQMQDYLADYPDLWAAIQGDDTLREMCTTPLLLSIFAYGFQDSPAEERYKLQNLTDSPSELRDRIFGIYAERRYIHERQRVESIGETLPFTLTEIYQNLGEAISERLTKDDKDYTMIVRQNFLNTLAPGQIASFTWLCTALHYLIPTENEDSTESGWRFTHLLLRAHFGFTALLARLYDEAEIARVQADEWKAILDKRRLAIFGLRRLGDPRAIPSLIEHLNDFNEGVQRQAIYSLGTLGGEQAVPLILPYLTDQSISIRRATAQALQELAWQPQTQEQEGAYAVAREAWWECIQIGEPAIPALINILDDRLLWYGFAYGMLDLPELIGVLDVLEGIGEPAVEPLIACLTDESPTVRLGAIRALMKIKDVRAVPALSAMLDDEDNDNDIRSTAALTLGIIGDPVAIPTLQAHLKDKSVETRLGVTCALALLGDNRASNKLIGYLRDKDAHNRSLAAMGLGRSGNTRAVRPLIACLWDMDRDTQDAAKVALQNIGTPEALAAIQERENDRYKISTFKALLKWLLPYLIFRYLRIALPRFWQTDHHTNQTQ